MAVDEFAQGGRVFIASDGQRYRAHLAPHEQRNGSVHPYICSVCFETSEGHWIGFVTVYWKVSLGDLSDANLGCMLRRAGETN